MKLARNLNLLRWTCVALATLLITGFGGAAFASAGRPDKEVRLSPFGTGGVRLSPFVTHKPSSAKSTLVQRTGKVSTSASSPARRYTGAGRHGLAVANSGVAGKPVSALPDRGPPKVLSSTPVPGAPSPDEIRFSFPTLDGADMSGARPTMILSDPPPASNRPHRLGSGWRAPRSGNDNSQPVPSMPGPLVAVVGDGGVITVTWADQSTNETGFHIEQARQSGSTWVGAGTYSVGAGRESININASPGTYRFRATAFNGGGDSPATDWSAPVVVTEPVVPDPIPAAPTNLVGVDSGLQSVILTWDDNSGNETRFDIQRNPAFSNGIRTTPANVATLTDASGLGTFLYRVRSANASGESEWTNWFTAVVADALPAAPTSLAAADAGNYTDARLTWIDNSNNEVSFLFERERQVGSHWDSTTQFSAPPNTQAFIDHPGTGTFRYRVASVNAVGNSAWTGWSQATILGPIDPGPGDPVPVITFPEVDAPRMAPHTVFVHATNSSLGNPTYRWQRCRFEWNFGDSSPTQTTTDPRTGAAVDLNSEQQGFNAAYVYERPGTYTITLRMTNEAGRVATVQAPVVILSDNRAVRYVDSVSGNDANDGAAPDRAWQNAATAFGRTTSNMKILFKRGQTFSVTSELNIGTRENLMVGAYGDGAKPRLLWQGGTGSLTMIKVSSYASNIIVDGLQLDSTLPLSANNKTSGVSVSGRNTTVRDCGFGELYHFVSQTSNPYCVLSQNLTGGRCQSQHYVFAGGEDIILLGCRTLRSEAEHPIRVLPKNGVSAQRVNYSFSQFDQEGHNGKGPLRYQAVQYGMVYRSALINGETNIGHDDYDVDYIVIDQTRFSDYNGGQALILKHNAMNLMLRNNSFEVRYGYRMAIATRKDPTYSGLYGIRNVDLIDNVFQAFDRTQNSPLVSLSNSGFDIEGLVFRGNRFIVGSGYTSTFLLVYELSDIVEASGNQYTDMGPTYQYVQIADTGLLDWQAWTALPAVSDEVRVP